MHAWLANTVHFTQSTPYSLHPTPYTLHSTLYTLHSILYILHPTRYTIHATAYTLHSTHHTLHATWQILQLLSSCRPSQSSPERPRAPQDKTPAASSSECTYSMQQMLNSHLKCVSSIEKLRSYGTSMPKNAQK